MQLNVFDEKLPDAEKRLEEYVSTGMTPEDIKAMRNELCALCGKYKFAHMGACDLCRWKR